MIQEANNNLNFREFLSDMKKLGFKSRVESGKIIFTHPSAPPNSLNSITVHPPHGGNGEAKADSLRHVKETLENIGWFDDPNNRKKFPYRKWDFEPSSIRFNSSKEETSNANKMYQEADVKPVFQMPNSVCVMKTQNGYNLCRSAMDRRPLLDTWFEDYGYDNRTGTIPCMKRDNYETMQTECYPIKQDGTLDMEHMIPEGKGKRRITLNESTIKKIVAEVIKNIKR